MLILLNLLDILVPPFFEFLILVGSEKSKRRTTTAVYCTVKTGIKHKKPFRWQKQQKGKKRAA